MLQEGSVESIRRVHRFLNNCWERLCFDGIFPVDMHEPAIHHAQHSLELRLIHQHGIKKRKASVSSDHMWIYVWGCCASLAHKCVCFYIKSGLIRIKFSISWISWWEMIMIGCWIRSKWDITDSSLRYANSWRVNGSLPPGFSPKTIFGSREF